MLMMLAPRFAKSVQYFGRTGTPAVDSKPENRRGNLKGNPADADDARPAVEPGRLLWIQNQKIGEGI